MRINNETLCKAVDTYLNNQMKKKVRVLGLSIRRNPSTKAWDGNLHVDLEVLEDPTQDGALTLPEKK